MDVKVQPGESDAGGIKESGDTDLRGEMGDGGGSGKGRESVSGREREVFRFPDDDIPDLATRFIWTRPLGHILQDQIYEQETAAQSDQDT